MNSNGRLLVVVFELDTNSATVAWQSRLVDSLASRHNKIVVLAQKVGKYTAPENVEIIEVPRLFQRWLRPLKAQWTLVPYLIFVLVHRRIDCLFIHMNSGWAYRLGPFARLLGIPVVVWYAHGVVTWRLKLVVACSTRMLTSSADGLRLDTAKRRIIGQGVDTKTYALIPGRKHRPDGMLSIVVTGRLSPRKRCEEAIETLALLHHHMPGRYRLSFIGTLGSRRDRQYQQQLLLLVEKRGVEDYVEFVGYLEASKIHSRYEEALLQLNPSDTGSAMDKAVLEALSAGVPVITRNIAFKDLLANYSMFFAPNCDPSMLKERILWIEQHESEIDRHALRALVVGKHDFDTYVDRVEKELREVIDG